MHPIPSQHSVTACLATLFDSTHKKTATGDGFLFSGNHHESVPRALFLDRRLTPLERNAWQVIRLMLQPDGVTAFPTYEQLRPYLTSMPCATQASLETVARAMTLLRLTRWLSLVNRRRSASGQVQSNLYVLHDEPLTPHEAIQLDPDYFALVSKAIDHSSKAIQRIGEVCLQEIADTPQTLGNKILPTRLHILTQRMSSATHKRLSTDQRLHDSEVGKIDSLRNQYGLASESESRLKPAKNSSLRNPKSICSSSGIHIINTTIPHTREKLRFPDRFRTLSGKQQDLTLSAIQHLEILVQQQILDEWDSRCKSMVVRKPAAYLLGIIQKALQGELNAWVEVPDEKMPTIKPASLPGVETEETQTDRETALRHIAKLKEIVAHGTLAASPDQS